MVKFKLVFKAAVSNTEATAPLKKEIQDGELGSLKVDPDSLKTTTDESNTKGPQANLIALDAAMKRVTQKLTSLGVASAAFGRRVNWHCVIELSSGVGIALRATLADKCRLPSSDQTTAVRWLLFG